VTVHGIDITGVDRLETGEYRVTFGCICGGYTAEKSAPTEADALTMATNDVRVHEATATGSPTVDPIF
jgi:hypothetical protein